MLASFGNAITELSTIRMKLEINWFPVTTAYINNIFQTANQNSIAGHKNNFVDHDQLFF